MLAKLHISKVHETAYFEILNVDFYLSLSISYPPYLHFLLSSGYQNKTFSLIFLYLTNTVATATIKQIPKFWAPCRPNFNLISPSSESIYSSLPFLFFCVISIIAKLGFKSHAKEVERPILVFTFFLFVPNTPDPAK